jgi:hypothetical protein
MRVPNKLRWELVVVDNGSSDATSAVIAAHAANLPLVPVFENTAGLSHARNAALGKARGRFLIWTDDDVRVDENWLCAYVRAFAEFPDGKIFGGCVIPILEKPSPLWFSEDRCELEGLFADRKVIGEARPFFIGETLPVGANFAVRAAEQKAHLFDPIYGYAPGRMRGGEEVELIKTLLGEGCRGYWVPNSKVFHIIPVSRQRLSYVWAWYWGQGEKQGVAKDLAGYQFGAGAILVHFLKAFARGLLFIFSRALLPSVIWMRQFKGLAFHSGAIAYLVSNERKGIRKRRRTAIGR